MDQVDFDSLCYFSFDIQCVSTHTHLAHPPSSPLSRRQLWAACRVHQRKVISKQQLAPQIATGASAEAACGTTAAGAAAAAAVKDENGVFPATADVGEDTETATVGGGQEGGVEEDSF